MSVIQGNAFSDDDAVDTGDIGHSLRCRSAASAYLSKTLSSPTSNTTWSFSLFAKEGSAIGVARYFLTSGYSALGINAGNQLTLWDSGGGQIANSAALSREPTGHRHIFFVSNGTTVKGYVNNLEVVSYTGTIPGLNSATVHNLMRHAALASGWFDGYLSRVCMVDGQALTPSSFGYLNTEINEWVTKSQSAVKAVVDAGGTNSFMLDFDDATSLTTLGYDKSAKGNNWTLNNFSLTAGTTYDHMLDVPGNSYATLNPIDTDAAVLSNGNLTAVMGSPYYEATRATIAVSSGKWYWEGVPSVNGPNFVIGVADATQPVTNVSQESPYGWGYTGAGTKRTNASSTAYGASFTNGDVIGVALDMDSDTVTFYKNGVSQGVAWSGLFAGKYIAPMISDSANDVTATVMFGQAPLHASATYHSAAGGYFRYAPPTGYKALCQANLPDVAIKNPKLHFDIKTRTGTAATYSVTGIGFPPDLVWVKSRGRALDHALYDSVRGVQKQLESNSTGAETTETAGLAAFNSDGYTGGALDQINGTTATNSFVDWLWKAGGAAVSNTAGSITSQVSANVDAGFSVVTYTGNYTAGATVGHGLGTAPKLVIAKNRDAAFDWPVFHLSAGATTAGLLNLTNSFGASAYFNSVAPTSSVVALGQNNLNNQNAAKCELLCFADIEGYSKAFSYTGNGSADGPYVHLGFKPRWLFIKSSTVGSQWNCIDATRSPYNVADERLRLNDAGAELPNDVYVSMDFASTGFKCRASDIDSNGAGQTYIGFAIADVAGKYSLAR